MDATTRFVVSYDQDFQLEECDGGPLPCSPEVYKDNPYVQEGQEVSYEDYLKYWGNPNRHIVFVILRQDECHCCGHWNNGQSLAGIDMMDDDPACMLPGTYTLEELTGYLKECALELDPAVRSNSK